MILRKRRERHGDPAVEVDIIQAENREIMDRVRRQWPEVLRHSTYAAQEVARNHISQAVYAAMVSGGQEGTAT